jgi:transposase
MGAYSMDLRVRVPEAAASGETTAESAERFAVSPAWVRRLKQRHRESGEIAPRKAKDTRVPKLRAHQARIRELLAATPDLTRAELRDEWKVAVALSTLWVAVRSLGLTFKRRRPGPRNGTARTWPPPGPSGRRRTVAPGLDPHRVVFVDETGADTAMGRRYGYGPKGKPVVGPVPPGRYKSRTFTAALRDGGLTAAQVLDGPMTGPRFREDVTAVLVPTLRPGDAVALGNLPCHESAAVRAAGEAAGCRLVFLPPYSPDLNPLELAFAKLERVLRTDGHRAIPKLMAFLRSAKAIFRADECRAYIRHCGYGEVATISPR